MLVLTMNGGDTTTITTPAGETILVHVLGACDTWNNIRIGIDAPDDYLILRQDLRSRLLRQLNAQPVFRLSSAGQPTELIIANNQQQAERDYHQRYPGCLPVTIATVDDLVSREEFEQLQHLWLYERKPPLSVVINDEGAVNLD